MHKYTRLFIGNALLLFSTVLIFDGIAELLSNQMVPFVLVLIFGISALGCVVLRGGAWYKSDLAERTIDELDKIEQAESTEE